MGKQAVWFVAIGGFIALGACATGEDVAAAVDTSANAPGGADGQAPLSPAQAYPDAKAYCAARAKVECSQAVVKACGGKSVESCLTARAALCLSQVPQGTELVADNVPACLEAVRGAYLDLAIDTTELGAISAACEAKIFSGPGVARAPCVTSYDCRTRDGLVCKIPIGEKSGRCLVPKPVAAGGSCPGEADVCSGEYFCHVDSKQCVAYALEGEPCNSRKLCGPRLQPCAAGADIFGGQCWPKTKAGSPCKDNTECADGLCSKLTGVGDGACTAAIKLEPLNAECSTLGR